MQALSMIDTSVNPLETVFPAKPAEPQGKQFGKVLNEQRRPEPSEAKQPAGKQEAKQVERQEPKQVEKQEPKQVEKQETKQAAKAEQQPAQQPKAEKQLAEQEVQAPVETVAVAQPKLQQIVMNLMKAIAGGETPEASEELGSTEELLSQLVQQLEGSELEGEQVLAGIDLSGLVEQLQELGGEGAEEQLTQLAVQLNEQLVNEEGLLKGAEMAAAQLPVTDPQASAPKLVENLAQARQILQQVIDSVAAQKAPEAIVVDEAVVAEGEAETAGQQLLFAEETVEEIDPRFAGLLKPRSENRMQQQPSLRQQVQGDTAKSNPEQLKAADATKLMTEVQPEQSEVAESVERLGSSPKQGLENLIQQAQGQAQANVAQVQNAAKVMPTTPMVQLPSGQQVAESQIFDQVVARFSGSVNAESGRMVLRLQPAELGSLKIELQVEGDRIRANIQAQSQQVQEVLERNLPQLRNALSEQGLKIDQFQVDVNKDQSQQQQFEQLAQQQQERQGSQNQPRWQQTLEPEEQIIPVAHLMQNGGGGISLHV